MVPVPDSHIHEFLRELPKCEHHVHLEGTLTPELLFELAKRNGVELPADFPTDPSDLYQIYDNFRDLDHFLSYYYIGMNVLRTERDFEDLAMRYFQKAIEDGVHHAEVFFDPQAHMDRGVSLEIVVSGFNKARKNIAKKNPEFSTKLIMCLLRHLPPSSAMETVQAAQPLYASRMLDGLGLDSSEKPFPPRLFAESYEFLRTSVPGGELMFTAHAGEEGDATYVKEALEALKVTRIDHGIRSAEDDSLLENLAASNTLLTVCPMSNVKLRCIEHVSQLPLGKFLQFNVPFSLNSDDPAYFGGYILDNYKAVHDSFQFDLETWCRIARFGIHGSFVSEERRAGMLQRLEAVREKYHRIAYQLLNGSEQL